MHIAGVSNQRLVQWKSYNTGLAPVGTDHSASSRSSYAGKGVRRSTTVGRRSCCQLIAVVACVGLAGCGGTTHATRPPPTGSVSGSAATAAPAQGQSASRITSTGTVPVAPSRPRSAPSAAAPPHPRPRPDPCPPRSAGALEQTDRIPSATTRCFHAIVRALWRGVRSDSPRAALYAFFPLEAYEQVKATGDPEGDYLDRLIAEYDLDLHAAHALLGSDPNAARLLSTIVPRGYVHWVPPGACYNRLGYYEAPNSRLVYRVGSEVRSFGIASLISWRGTWYVVHLGAVTRSGYGGVVDDPSDGTGTPAPSLTC